MKGTSRLGIILVVLGIVLAAVLMLPRLSRAAERNELGLDLTKLGTAVDWNDPAQVCSPDAAELTPAPACEDPGGCYLSDVRALRAGQWNAVSSSSHLTEDASSVFVRGWAAWCNSSEASALAIWQQAHQLIGSRFLKAGILAMSEPQVALRDLKVANELDPTVAARFALGQAYDLTGDQAHALALYQSGLKSGEPITASMYWQAAELEYRLRDYTNARIHIEAALQQNPNDWLNWQVDGNILMALQDWQSAERAYTRVVGLNPTYVHGNVGLAFALAQQGQIAQAQAPILRAVQAATDKHDQAGYLAQYAFLAAQQGDDATATEFYEKATTYDPQNATYWSALVKAYVKRADCANAQRAYVRLSAIQNQQNKTPAPPPECPAAK